MVKLEPALVLWIASPATILNAIVKLESLLLVDEHKKVLDQLCKHVRRKWCSLQKEYRK